MSEQEYLQIIFDKLKSYLTDDDNSYDSTQMINSIISTIIQFFDCDYKKLADALDQLVVMKNLDSDSKYSSGNNKFDISSKTKISIKGFLSKGQPNLFFFLDDSDKPYAIVKNYIDGNAKVYSVEISNNPEVLLKYKNDKSVLKNSYVYVEEYNFNKKACFSTKNMYAETIPESNGSYVNEENFSKSQSDYAEFLRLLKNSVSDIDVSTISSSTSDILFLNFYDKAKSYSGQDKLLPFEDMVYLINKIIYNEQNMISTNSEFINNLSKIINSGAKGAERKKFTIQIDNVPVNYEVINKDGYLSVDVFLNSEKLGSSMIIASEGGFSLVRSFGEFMNTSEGAISHVVNISDNQVRILSIDDTLGVEKVGKKFDSRIIFDKTGVVKFVSSEREVMNGAILINENAEQPDKA